MVPLLLDGAELWPKKLRGELLPGVYMYVCICIYIYTYCVCVCMCMCVCVCVRMCVRGVPVHVRVRVCILRLTHIVLHNCSFPFVRRGRGAVTGGLCVICESFRFVWKMLSGKN